MRSPRPIAGPGRHWRRRRGSAGRRDDRESGYVLALVAAALVPLVGIAAVSVDLALWQAQGADLQRAADAAALAAVPGLSSPEEATSRALAAAAANGVVHGVDGVQVIVDAVDRSRVRVTVTSSNAPRVFSVPFLGAFGLERVAVAEWAQPVSLGSPRNFLGTGTLAGNADANQGLPGVPALAAEGYWLAVTGPCASREQGDVLTAVSVGNFVSPNPPSGDRPWRGCTSAADPAITMVRADGPAQHVVGIRVPQGYTGGAFTVQLFDASHCSTSPMDTDTAFDPFSTTYTLRGPASASGATGDAPALGEARFTTGTRCGSESVATRGYNCAEGSWAQRWCNFAGVTSPEPGALYVLTLSVSPVRSTVRHGANGYAIRIMAGPPAATGAFVPCSTDPRDSAVAYRPSGCVAVEGREWLSVTTTGGGSAATVSLAEVGPEHAGSDMEVALFDVGEGSSSVQLLDPTGAAVGFTWTVDMAPGDVPPTGGISGVVPPGGALDVGAGTCGGGHPQRGPGRLSGSKYNERMLRLRVRLPTDPAAVWGGREWWRVRYQACGSRVPTDRTSWAVWVDGQPVRLIG